MKSKIRGIFENIKTEASRNSTKPQIVNSKILEKNKIVRFDKSPVSSQRLFLCRSFLKSPEPSISNQVTSRKHKTPINKNKSQITLQKDSNVSKDISLYVPHALHDESYRSSNHEIENIPRPKASNRDKIEQELGDSLKIYTSGFSEFENSCVTKKCVKHTDKNTEFYWKINQVHMGFCASCAVKYAGMGLKVEPYKIITKPKISKKDKIDEFLSECDSSRFVLAEKKRELLRFHGTIKKENIEQHILLENLFEMVSDIFQNQKEIFSTQLSKFFNKRQKLSDERLECLEVETRFVEKIEKDVSDNYQSILENVEYEDFDVILGHHKSQMSQKMEMVEKLKCEKEDLLNVSETRRITERIRDVLKDEINKIYPGIEFSSEKYLSPTFQNFSSQNIGIKFSPKEEKNDLKSVIAKSETEELPKIEEEFQIKNIPSIENLMEMTSMEGGMKSMVSVSRFANRNVRHNDFYVEIVPEKSSETKND